MPNLQLGDKPNRQRSWRIFFCLPIDGCTIYDAWWQRTEEETAMTRLPQSRSLWAIKPGGEKERTEIWKASDGWWHRERICCGVSHLFLFAILILSAAAAGLKENSDDETSRDNFPKSFVFGAGASAYQVINGSFQFSNFNFLWTYMHVWFGSFPASERLILGFYLGEFFVGWRSSLWRWKSS